MKVRAWQVLIEMGGAFWRTSSATISAGNPECSRQADLTVIACVLGALLAGYSIILIERSQKVLFGLGPFLVEQSLVSWEKVLFLLALSGEIITLILTTSYLANKAISIWFGGSFSRGRNIVIGVVLVYFSIVTAQYNVFQYFKSGISLAIVGGLSGGITRNGLIYVQNELGGLLHLVLAFLILVVATVWVAMKYGSRATDRLARTRLVAALSSWRGLIALNAICTLDGAGPTATDCSTRRRKSFSSVTRVRSIETKRELVQVSPSAPC